MMRKILLYLSLKYQGNYLKIYQAIQNKEKVDVSFLNHIEQEIHANYLTILDADYPECFKHISCPPFVLYYYGNKQLLQEKETLVVIGKRQASEYGLKMTNLLISQITNHHPCIISGLAKGIDAKAHQSALFYQLPTIAVLGCGIDFCYPIENQELYQQVKAKGLILSEYPNQLPPQKQNFLVRNRLLAALGKTILVIEANRKSGTMNTVSYALEYGKDICCVPTNALEESGCNYLIQQGARLVETGKDIF